MSVFFFFKQKTAYEMRISDWSSDVCSSDLEAVAYVTGTQYSRPVTKLDAGGIQIQGDLFHLWAGPVTVAPGVEARRESQSTSRGAQNVAGAFAIQLFSSDLQGSFSVTEWFGDIDAPLLAADAIKLVLNGAARYFDHHKQRGH